MAKTVKQRQAQKSTHSYAKDRRRPQKGTQMTKATAQMGGLTRSDIELMCEQAIGLNPRWSRANATALGDLALQALESVRSEALTKALQEIAALALAPMVDMADPPEDQARDWANVAELSWTIARRALSPARVAEGEVYQIRDNTIHESAHGFYITSFASEAFHPTPESPAKEQPGEVASMVRRLRDHENEGVTSSDRYHLREEAAELLAKLGQANVSIGPTCPSFVCLTPKGCALYGCKMIPPPPERP